MQTGSSYNNRGLGLRVAVLTVLASLVIIPVAHFVTRSAEINKILAQQSVEVSGQAQLRISKFNDEIEDYIHVTQFLSRTPPIQGIIRASANDGNDPLENNRLETWEKRLAIIFREYLLINDTIMQARFIGLANNGKELVRVERDSAGAIEVIAQDKLQEKGESAYFREAIKYKKGETYISPINLNRENGVVDSPFTPTLRFATPIYDSLGAVFGVIIVNVYAEPVINSTLAEKLPPDYTAYITNADNDFIYHPAKGMEYGFDLGKRNTWADEFANPPQAGELTLSRVSALRYYTYSFQIASLDSRVKAPLNFIITVPQSIVLASAANAAWVQAGILLVLLALSGVLVYFYLSHMGRKVSLLRDQARLSAIIDNSSDAIISVSLRGVVESWNKSAEKMFDYVESEAVGKNLAKLIVPDRLKSEYADALKTINQGQTIKPYHTIRQRKDGARVYVSVSSFPIKSKWDGRAIGAAAIIRDISDKVEAENQIKALNQKLASDVKERTQELNQAVSKVLSANKSKSDFVANMSHEIRTPMSAISENLQVLRQTPLNSQQEDCVEKLEGASQSMRSFVNDLIDYSKIEAGQLELEPHAFNLDKLLREISYLVSAHTENKDIEVVFYLDHKIPNNLVGDEARLQQVLIKLLSNAAKFTNQGEITLSVKLSVMTQDELELKFSVEDTGIGMTEDHCQNIFETFVQDDAAAPRKYEGSGLGLGICKQLIEMMGGEIQVRSELGKGSAFSFNIKVAVDEKRTGELNINRPELKALRILIADDNKRAAACIKELALTLGWSSDVVLSLAELASISQDTQKKYDAVFVDLNMIKASGATPTEELQKIRRSDTPPALILMTNSGKSIPGLRDAQIDAAFDGLLSKPVTPSMLLDSVAEARASQSKSAHKRRSQENSVMTGASLSGIRILLVEDNLTNQQIASQLLQAEGAFVDIASTGKEAITAITHAGSQFDIVLMDIQMPEMDGYAATRALREKFGYKTLPIVAMTANVLEKDREECLAAGMNDHIGKPFDINDLCKIILKYTDETRLNKTAPPQETGDVTLESIFRKGAAIGINVKEAVGRFGSNFAAYRIALEGFENDVNRLLIHLSVPFNTEETREIEKELHIMGGLSKTIGADSLSMLCKRVEILIMNNALRPQVVSLLRRSLEAALHASRKILLYLDELTPQAKRSDSKSNQAS
ncbi:response regulator [Hahella sp. KA22]|uniref:response regulator n=1 Tax=Hahella sp. KA22 TaxID=1628392 RepID=UPI000FDD5431|nr:response regulator [Hahella sp. KA22]AZZ92142.1 response regulator [Hahella sp. KA22]QAY55513.1 response regulator [Hahella sp. KA22]